MGVGPGDEVITVSHTFIATVEAIVLCGARPVFVDVQPDTYLMDVSQIEAKITPRTKAILPVHLYGQMADMEPILRLAQQYNLKVVEDCAQAHGATYQGKRAGSLGNAGGFSFYYSKNLGAYGEGGFVTTDDDTLAERIQMIRDHGSGRRYYHDIMGFNSRLDEIQAVVLRAKLPHLEAWNELRNQHAALYGQLLEGSPAVTPVICPDRKSVYHLYVIKVPQRDELQAYLKDREIFTGIHYPNPVHLQPSMGYLGYKAGDFPVTEQVVKEIISLPMYAELGNDAIHGVTDAIKMFFK